jgi:UDP-glucose 4-epimerase
MVACSQGGVLAGGQDAIPLAMRILITGGAGFIGSWLAYFLDEHQILTVDDLSGGYRRNVNGHLQQIDITDHRMVDRVWSTFQPELVIHCAAYAAEGLSHWMRRYNYTQNLIGWANVANASVEVGVKRIVALSSMSVYGSQTPPFTEELPVQPEDPYGAAKAAMEADLKALTALQKISSLIVRPHNVYGPRQNLADPYRNVVAIFMRQALQKQDITVYGTGEQVRAFSYVEDVAQAIARLALSDALGIVNVGGEEPVTIRSLARQVQGHFGYGSEIVNLPPRHEVADAWCRHDRLRELLGGWDPTPLAIGLGRMADWAKGMEIGRLREYEYESTVNLYEPWRR